jgi:hypothetical protein
MKTNEPDVDYSSQFTVLDIDSLVLLSGFYLHLCSPFISPIAPFLHNVFLQSTSNCSLFTVCFVFMFTSKHFPFLFVLFCITQLLTMSLFLFESIFMIPISGSIHVNVFPSIHPSNPLSLCISECISILPPLCL